MGKINYTNKTTLNPQPSIADENKVTSGDMNEIKSVVNGNFTNNSVTVGDTTPTGDNITATWIKASGNIFDSSNANILNALLRTSDNTLYASSSERSLYVECKPNTTYRISKKVGARFRVDERASTPTTGSANINPIIMDSASKYVYTTSANGNYLVVNYFTTSESGTEQDMLNSISIEVVPSINVLENNIYKEIYNKPEILFDNASGVNSNITLSKSAANYSYIEIFYKNTDGYCSSVKAINETDVSLTITYQASDKLWYTSKVVTINGISISNKNYAIGWINNSNNTGYGNTNNMKITRVIGYK